MPESRPRLSVFARIVRWPALALGGIIWIYQQAVSPALAALNPTCGCRFAPTCSHYAREALREQGLLVGLFLTVCRLAKCGPWHPGGEDPVPARKFSCVRVSKATPAQS
ncbi:membrane protein insertion efficiency factor YidD [Oleiharenicola lentus]|uniref:membrane protein insertion efficiency factor YidD n=1 Tax=Oleiharenicola lentus TaxID=2508720 RepID=UPI003F6743D2